MDTTGQSDEPRNQDRRRFFATGMRLLALSCMGGYAAHQLIKGQRLEGDPSCVKLHTCQSCVELTSGCALPKAEAYRTQNPPGASGPESHH